MKSTKLVMASIALCMSMSLSAFSQTDSTKKDTTKTKTDTTTTKKDTTTANIQQGTTSTSMQDSQSNNQQAGSANSQQSEASVSGNSTQTANNTSSVSKPNFGRYYIPVLGTFQSSEPATESKSVTVSGDESNPGKIWIEGVTGTKFYALLKAVPGTYKVPVQMQDDKSIQEGTVIYDESNKQISICLGCGYKDGTPSEALTTVDGSSNEASVKTAKSKSKVKAKTVINFSGTKANSGTASIGQ